MSGGGCGGRGLRVLLLVILLLVGVEFMFGSILETSTGSLRAYLYTQASHEPQTKSETRMDKSSLGQLWPKRTQSRRNSSDSPKIYYRMFNTSTLSIINSTRISWINTTSEPKAQHLESWNILIEKLSSITRKSENANIVKTKLPPCPSIPPNLGRISVNKSEVSLEAVEKQHSKVRLGGRYAPKDCTALHKVAIIVPYRDRVQHLAIFLNNLHPMLMKQQLDYGIFIVEQYGDRAFNRAKLMNVGYMEAQKTRPGGWDCFVFHDIDLLPLDSRNIYSCPKQPRHMSVAIDKFHYILPYEGIFGGVSAMKAAHFKDVNGFSNRYWGWGGEDDDMFYRIKKMKLRVTRYRSSIACYTMLKHSSLSPNPKRYQLLSQTKKVFKHDGLSSLKYQIINVTKHRLYTSVLADINEHPTSHRHHSLWDYITNLLFGICSIL